MSSRGSITLVDAAATILLLSISMAIALHYSKLVFSNSGLLPYQIEKCVAQKIGETCLLEVLERTDHLALVENPYLFKDLLSSTLDEHPLPPGVVLDLKVDGELLAEWGDFQGSEVLASVSMTFSTREGLIEMTCYVGEAALKHPSQ